MAHNDQWATALHRKPKTDVTVGEGFKPKLRYGHYQIPALKVSTLHDMQNGGDA